MHVKFVELTHDQFSYGGVKYASTSKKESTDELVEDFGWNWLFGTQAKYVKRFRNTQREKDTLKIATYFFIDWLKLGYHISPTGTASINCTTVPVKAEFFPKFIARVKEDYPDGTSFSDSSYILDTLYEIFKALRLERDENLLLYGFVLCENLWRLHGFDQVTTHETDTWNPEDKKDGQTKTNPS